MAASLAVSRPQVWLEFLPHTICLSVQDKKKPRRSLPPAPEVWIQTAGTYPFLVSVGAFSISSH